MLPRPATRLALVGGLVMFAGCPSATTTASGPSATPASTAEAPPVTALPPGCEASLAGQYHHEEDETYRYDVTDDGKAVVISAYRQHGAAREPLPEEEGAAGVIRLQRTPEGFAGSAKGVATTHSGESCEVEFPYQVVACSPQGLTLNTHHEFTLNEDCSVEDESLPEMVENHLVRDQGPPLASAAADAGP